MLNTKRWVENPTESMDPDKFDAQCIVEWFQADPGAPAPGSARHYEGIEYAHDNPAAWALIDKPDLPLGMSIDQAKLTLAAHAGI